jgi:DNA N-6-adenine-methyltransferase Dam
MNNQRAQLVLVTNKPEHERGGSLPLARYDAMCRAIVEAHRVDEAKEIRDKAMALAVYARQAKDTEAERRCCEIRLRAERRAGELLREREMARGGQPFQATARGARGVETLAELGISYGQSAQWQKVAAMSAPKFEAAVAAVAMPTIGAVLAASNHRTQCTGDTEWVTPTEPIEAARSVFGGVIDLDPARNAAAQRRIQAKRFYTQADDGLVRDWPGRIWLNPRYAWPAIERFIDKLAEQLAAGNTTEAIVLTSNSSDTGWFQRALGLASALCLIQGRINFLNRNGRRGGSPLQGQAFFYSGRRAARFKTAYRRIGRIVYPDPD